MRGESIALTTDYRNTSSGGRIPTARLIVYGYSIAVDPTRTVEQHHAAQRQSRQSLVDDRRGSRGRSDRSDGHAGVDHVGRFVVDGLDRPDHRLQRLSRHDGGRRVGDADRDLAADRHHLHG